MQLPYEMTRCHGIVNIDQACSRRHQCLRYLTMETDPKDRKYSQAMCLCYIADCKQPYYFYYLPQDE